MLKNINKQIKQLDKALKPLQSLMKEQERLMQEAIIGLPDNMKSDVNKMMQLAKSGDIDGVNRIQKEITTKYINNGS